ncbi:MAG: type II toxin-antitoxin system prevent-host-death family antitoxin [Defluviicoccus sp.]|nr:type II toxin-antitoxin system prevent-host-death family antitoxin [Defluviicoccus sp.]MDE0277182.1 type II toxin-antitoxin system prevent-host-death family antitoxin [Defluviicoccus sp.]
MTLAYSIAEARARFSDVIRRVREGRTVTVTHRGEPVAEIRPVERGRERTLEERLEELRRTGRLFPAANPRQPFRPVARRPGALARFLAERAGEGP